MERKYIYEVEVAKRIIESECILIYGAGVIACQVANCLRMEPYNKEIDAFVVTDCACNPSKLMGHKVISVQEATAKYSDALILIAVIEKYYADILATLKEHNIKNIIPMTFESDLWAGIRGNAFRDICIEKYGSYKTIDEELFKGCHDGKRADVHIYSACCHVDKTLDTSNVYPWEYNIQVGTSFTEKRICDIQDNIGDNISDKNIKYSELTALYWIWKNDSAKYAGLGHYRRHFALTEKQVDDLGNSDIDVVLTIPIFNFPNVRAMYEHDHYIEDWDSMLRVLKEMYPEYYQTAIQVQNGIYYYAYNMFIARKEIIDEYCSWLFPLLERCEKECQPHNDKYQNRVIGFIAERLLTVFFLHNWNKWNIVHAEKNFLN